ncbi:Uncharacterised protein [Mycobacteroides abscessus subsp. abscessus]|nr:Uncharacterised protein [Mycobacteroides abscessus subsp. abscessus]
MRHIGKISTTAVRTARRLCSTLTGTGRKYISSPRPKSTAARDNKTMARRTTHQCASTHLPEKIERCERFLTIALHLVAQIPALSPSSRQNLRQLVHDNTAAKARWRADASEMIPSSVLLHLHQDHLKALDEIASNAAAVAISVPPGNSRNTETHHSDERIFAAADAIDRTRRSIQNTREELTLRSQQEVISQSGRMT